MSTQTFACRSFSSKTFAISLDLFRVQKICMNSFRDIPTNVLVIRCFRVLRGTVRGITVKTPALAKVSQLVSFITQSIGAAARGSRPFE